MDPIIIFVALLLAAVAACLYRRRDDPNPNFPWAPPESSVTQPELPAIGIDQDLPQLIRERERASGPTLTGSEAPLPLYRCHKQVRALRIEQILIDTRTGSAKLVPERPYAPFEVSEHYLTKHQPRIGGYYIRYADGYESWSPAKQFTDGYTRIA